jgi:hypothetical protein
MPYRQVLRAIACAAALLNLLTRPTMAQDTAPGQDALAVLRGAAVVLNVPTAYPLARLRSGDTLAALATERGVSRDALVAGTAGWAAGVGEVPQLLGRATAAEVWNRVERIRAGLWGNLDRPLRAVPPVLPQELLQGAAELLYLQPQELAAQVRDGGETLVQVAASQGLTRDDVVSYPMERLEARLRDGLRDGTGTADEIPALVAAATPTIERFVDQRASSAGAPLTATQPE